MNDGVCYAFINDHTIATFPDLSCTDGNVLPSFESTTSEYYYVYSDGRLRHSSSSTIQGGYGSQYIAHIYHGEFLGDSSIFILPCTLILLAFFAIIYRWFIRLRG